MLDRSEYIYFCEHCKTTMSAEAYERNHLCSACQSKQK